MSKSTAPYIPRVQAHWSFSDELAQRKRALERRKQAIVLRAQRECQVILGAVLYRAITGEKPVIKPSGSISLPRKLTTADLL